MKSPLQIITKMTGKLIQCIHRMASGCLRSRRMLAFGSGAFTASTSAEIGLSDMRVPNFHHGHPVVGQEWAAGNGAPPARVCHCSHLQGNDGAKPQDVEITAEN